MPRFFFDINGRHDDIGVTLDDREAAIADARTTILRLAEYDQPAAVYGDSWTCVLRDRTGSPIHRVTLAVSMEDLGTPGHSTRAATTK